MYLLSPMPTLYPSLIIFPYLIPLVLVQCGEVYGSWNSYLCIFLRPPITAFLQGPNAQLITPVLYDALGLGSSLPARRKCCSHKNNRVNCSFAYSNLHVFRNIWRRRHFLNRTVASLLRICLPSNNIHNNVTCSLSLRFHNKSRMVFWCRIHLWFRLMGGLYGKSMTSPRQIPGSPSRLLAQHRKLTAMRYYGNVMTTTIWRLHILHLQQYSRRLNLFVCFFLCEFQCSIAIRFVMSDIVQKDGNITCYLHRCETSLFILGKKIR